MTKLLKKPKLETNEIPKQSDHFGMERDFIELFPLPRYFQIHFEQIHKTNFLCEQEISRLNKRTMELEQKLDHAITLLNASMKGI